MVDSSMPSTLLREPAPPGGEIGSRSRSPPRSTVAVKGRCAAVAEPMWLTHERRVGSLGDVVPLARSRLIGWREEPGTA